MASQIQIVNLALSNIRAGSINSLTEASLPAQVASLKYDILRDRCLTEIPWQFARHILPLASVTTEIFNWGYAYSYPINCLDIARLIPEHEELTTDTTTGVVSKLRDSEIISLKTRRTQIAYEVFNFDGVKLIGADETNLRIDYTIKIENPNLFSNDFILAFSHLLAAEMAVPIVGGEQGREFRKDSLALYDRYLKSAITTDLNDGHIEPSESEFITARS